MKQPDQQQENWHAMPVDQVLSSLDTSFEGLSDETIRARLGKYGPNRLQEEAGTPLAIVFLHQFKDPLIYILLIAGVVTLLLQDITEEFQVFEKFLE